MYFNNDKGIYTVIIFHDGYQKYYPIEESILKTPPPCKLNGKPSLEKNP
jgi:hypothetical protein